MAARLLAAIERLKKRPLVVLVLLFASAVAALAQFTGAAQTLVELVAPKPPPKADPRAELARLGIAFTPETLATAATGGDERAVGLLIDAGMRGPALATPLIDAARAGQLAIARRLRDAGADPGSAAPDEDSAFAAAAQNGHADVVRMFLERPVTPALVEDGFVAAASGHRGEMLALLGPRLIDPRRAAGRALTGLLVPSGDDAVAAPTLRTILAYRPDLTALDDNGQTPLIAAVTRDMTAATNALAASRAGVDARGKCGSGASEQRGTALHCASVRGTATALEAVSALVAGGANVDARDDDRRTPLMLAAANGDAAITRALLEARADASLRDPGGRSALDLARAARFGDPKATVALLAPR